MLIVRFAMPASWRVRWKSAIVVAVIAESGTSPKCLLTMLSRSCSSSMVRGEHRMRFAVRYEVDCVRQPLRSLLVGREPPVSGLFDSSRSRRVATRRFVVRSRFRYRCPPTVKSVQYCRPRFQRLIAATPQAPNHQQTRQLISCQPCSSERSPSRSDGR